MAERNTKPIGGGQSSASSSSPEAAPAPVVNTSSHLPHLQGGKVGGSQMDQALWLSRATAMLRAEEERRQHEHLMQILLNSSQVTNTRDQALKTYLSLVFLLISERWAKRQTT